ncbi:hypothetical protein [Desulfotruncus alcoholivorax]|nr:hypothetical protein [Desulfotruncus alcoholivorax]
MSPFLIHHLREATGPPLYVFIDLLVPFSGIYQKTPAMAGVFKQ